LIQNNVNYEHPELEQDAFTTVSIRTLSISHSLAFARTWNLFENWGCRGSYGL